MCKYLLSCRYVPVISLLLLLTMTACCLAGVSEPPEPVPPVYTQLKNLHITTALVKDGKPNAVIAAPSSGLYKEPAKDIQQAVKEAGLMRLEGKSYVVQDGDIMHFRFAV